MHLNVHSSTTHTSQDMEAAHVSTRRQRARGGAARTCDRLLLGPGRRETVLFSAAELNPEIITLRRQWHPTPVLLPGKSHGWRSLVGCSPWGREESDTTEQLHFDFSLSGIGEGNGNPLQYSCLENPRDGGAWWALVYGVTQSRTQLKRLSSGSSSSSSSSLFRRRQWHPTSVLLLREFHGWRSLVGCSPWGH